MSSMLATAPDVRSRPVADTVVMLRRALLRQRRYPTLIAFAIGVPLVILVVFVYVFGGAFGAGVEQGISVGAEGRAAYLGYITPAVLLFAIAGAGQNIAIAVAMDATAGIMARFRTMSVSPAAVLAGPVLGSVVQALLASTVVVLAATALGYRPGAGLGDWGLLVAMVALTAAALSWVCLAMGLSARSVETASNTPMLFTLLPFLGSGFVPVDTMPAGVRWFAEYQPFTPIIETLRALLDGTGADRTDASVAVAWCIALSIAGYVWARSSYRRERRL